MQALLEPTSVAVIGASARERAMGNTVLRNFKRMGFSGRAYGVHPTETEVEGVRCYPSISQLPETVDAGIVALRRELVPDAMEELGAAGTKAAVVFASGLGEVADTDGLASKVQAITSKYGMALTGPNCMGLVNVTNRTPLYSSALPDYMEPGVVAAVSQSGSGCIALICSGRLRLAYVISAGNELVTTASDYLHFLADDPNTRVISMMLETIRRPDEFAAGAVRARQNGKPVVVLKAGLSDRGQEAAAAHTGALIASSDEYEAFFRRCGVIQVSDLDELIEVSYLWSVTRRTPAGSRLGFVSLSGGENALLLDIASDLEIDFPEFSEGTKAEISRALPPFASINNPLDATGVAVFDHQMYGAVLQAVSNDPSVDYVGIIQDAPPALDPSHQRSVAETLMTAASVANQSAKPFGVISNIGGSVHPTATEALASSDIPLLAGTRQGLLAIRHFISWHLAEIDHPQTHRAPTASNPPRWTWPESGKVSPFDAVEVVGAYGIDFVDYRRVNDLTEALLACRDLGFPVAVKAASDEILHKTEHGLVRLDVRNEDQLASAVEAIRTTTGGSGDMLIQPMISGLETIVGARISPTFGPIVLLGAGGVLVELIRETTSELAPMTMSQAQAMIERTILAELLAGYRGQPPGDREALARCIVAVGALADDLKDDLGEFEINPLIVLARGQGARAVDVVMTGRDRTGPTRR
jgi:acetyltransferase